MICRADAAQEGANTRREFFGGERLGEIIVGASFKPSDHVVGVASRRDHHNGHAAFGADSPTQLKTIDARQHDVDQHHISRVSDK